MLVFIIAVMGLTSTAFAQETSVYDLYTDIAENSLSISGTTATCTSKATGYSGKATKILITQTLQKKNSSGNWDKVNSWTKTFNSNKALIVNYEYKLSKGTYRLKSVFKVYSGSDYETITKYSSGKTVK